MAKQQIDKSLFVNINDYRDDKYPFNIIIGGRGTGKTFSALRTIIGKDPVYKPTEKSIYMRRTLTELEEIWDTGRGEGLNPFKPVNRECITDFGVFKMTQKAGGIYHREYAEEKGKWIPVGAPVGYALAMSVIAGMRSISAEECGDLYYDEFVPEKHVKKIKDEANAFFNGYETICRDREMLGLPPCKAWLISNSNDIYNPIFVKLKIIRDCERMLAKGEEHKYYPERGLAVHILKPNPLFVEEKSKTALYKLTQGTDFEKMSLSNEFSFNDFSNVGFRNISGYLPLYTIDNFTIFEKKGAREYYVSYTPVRLPSYKVFEARTDLQIKEINRTLSWFPEEMVRGRVTYESIEIKERLMEILF